ncbi:MAG: 2-dehydro-3-deoxygalactonokinase [Glaciimonas sp.]|nr:2-dehydro-3-deoxygalactonokinase [Glaciimonas sp.]
MKQTKLIALDWGTSSLRAYRFDAEGQVQEQRNLPWGIMHLPETVAGSDPKTGFELAFLHACGAWLAESPQTPVIACGMVGSVQGWCEVAYQQVPIALDKIGAQLTTLQTRDGYTLHIVPGLIQHTTLPNVMRGEETQVIGALALAAEKKQKQQKLPADVLIGMPGTHSKWVQVQQHRKLLHSMPATIVHFDTFMTGEVYAALCQHTILGRPMQGSENAADAMANAAFMRGLEVAQTENGRIGVLSTIFSTRTLGLTGALDGAGQREYLSGLLIGHEIAALQAHFEEQIRELDPIILIGEEALCARYKTALEVYGMTDVEVVTQATECGLWTLAMQAGLLASPEIN